MFTFNNFNRHFKIQRCVICFRIISGVASDRLSLHSGGSINVSLSPQNLLSCNKDTHQQGCEGGHLDRAWWYVRKVGWESFNNDLNTIKSMIFKSHETPKPQEILVFFGKKGAKFCYIAKLSQWQSYTHSSGYCTIKVCETRALFILILKTNKHLMYWEFAWNTPRLTKLRKYDFLRKSPIQCQAGKNCLMIIWYKGYKYTMTKFPLV